MPPEYPEEKYGKSRHSLFDANVPIVHSLNTNVLVNNGWARVGNSYYKGDSVVVYNGVHWILNGNKQVNFLEDLNDKN